MPRCNPCNRSFGSDEALAQHVKDSSAHRQKRKAPAPTKTPTFFTFPHLHQAVLDEAPELSPAPQFTKNTTQACEKMPYDTFIMARFSCKAHGPTSVGWSSKMVTIMIRLHRGNRYSAVVYNQRCKRCKSLGVMELDETSYVERVAYRLKKWAGIRMDEPIYVKKETPPHRSELCEGCKAGLCQKGMGGEYGDF